jgi:hypothetical protein
MRPWRLTVTLGAVAALSGTVVFAAWEATVGIRLVWSSIEDAATPIADYQTTRDTKSLSVATKSIDIPLADAVAITPVEATDDLALPLSAAPLPAVSVADLPKPDPDPPETRMQLASLGPSYPETEYPSKTVRPVEPSDECLMVDSCVNEYLWSLYERTPKVDSDKVTERIKVTVKKKGKTRTITKTKTKYVPADFTWKDPAAAQNVDMQLKEYVIGGMDRSFRLKLYRALRTMDAAGLMPGITSAFRDNYRQSIATGKKAATDSSYHGGSRRGGYGHGLAADLVSVKGETRMERYGASEELWKWIDAHENELGIGRPYLDRDPPHVGPIDGKEYTDKRHRPKVQIAGLKTKNVPKAKVALKTKIMPVAKTALKTKNAPMTKAGLQTKNLPMAKAATKKPQLAVRSYPAAAKRAKPAKPSKVSGLQASAIAQR